MGNTVDIAFLKFTGEDVIVDFARRFVMDKGVEVFNFWKAQRPARDRGFKGRTANIMTG